MKTNIFCFFVLLFITLKGFSQKKEQDSIKVVSLDEVLVKGVRVTANAPVTHSNLNKEDIEARNLGQDITSLIGYLPSVVSSSDAGAGIGYSTFRVRGSDASRVNVTINGIPYNDAESQSTFWVNLGDFASSTESLQLQRGVGTSTNGVGAFGASLNILTDATSDIANGEISNSFGSYGTRKHTVKYSTGKLNDHFEFSGRFSKIYSDGYIDRAFTDLKSFFLQGSYTDDNTLFKALVFGNKEKTYQAWNGLTKADLKKNRKRNYNWYDNETDNYWQDHYQLHWNEQLTDKLSTNIGFNYTKGEGYFEQFLFETTKTNLYNQIVVFNDIIRIKVNDKYQDAPATNLIVRRWLDNDFYVMNFNATYKGNTFEITGGTSFSFYKGDHFGEVIWAKQFRENASIRDRYYFSDASKTDNSVFVKATYDVSKKLSFFADLQGRFINYKTTGLTSKREAIDIDKDFSFFNPKAGLTFIINNNNSIYGSYARANREPNRDDFKNGVDTHETLNDFELGWRFKNDIAKVNTNLYFMDYRNQLVLTGAVDNTGSPLKTTSGKSYRAGIEIDADINITNKVSFKPSITFSKNENIDFYKKKGNNAIFLGDTPIAYSPEIVANSIISYKPINNLTISFLSKYVGEQFLNNHNNKNAKLDSYSVNDVNLVYTIPTKKIFKSITLSGLVNNIFNEEYESNGFDYGDDGVYYFPQATINFLVGASLKF